MPIADCRLNTEILFLRCGSVPLCGNNRKPAILGADILVAGSAIFQSREPRAQLAELIRLAAPPAEAAKGAESMFSQS